VGAADLILQGLNHFGIPDTAALVDKLSLYVLELDRWNKRINLTGKGSVEPIICDLLYDALFLFSTIEHPGSLLDAGSGNGILAITFACLDEEMKVYSVDKNLKKIQFQRHVKRSLELLRLLPVHGRIEALEPLNVDTVVAKGLGPTRQVLEMVSSHLLQEGRVYLPKGIADEEADHPGYAPEKTLSYRLPQSPKRYRLLQYKKIS
jgi:16S rRNA (guanine527-N7)-methyltransferase